jgi:hypothetical protein
MYDEHISEINQTVQQGGCIGLLDYDVMMNNKSKAHSIYANIQKANSLTLKQEMDGLEQCVGLFPFEVEYWKELIQFSIIATNANSNTFLGIMDFAGKMDKYVFGFHEELAIIAITCTIEIYFKGITGNNEVNCKEVIAGVEQGLTSDNYDLDSAFAYAMQEQFADSEITAVELQHFLKIDRDLFSLRSCIVC